MYRGIACEEGHVWGRLHERDLYMVDYIKGTCAGEVA